MSFSRQTFFTIFFLFGSLSLSASLPDSLLETLSGLEDSAKINRLMGHCRANLYNNPQKSREICEKAIIIAEQNGSAAMIGQVVNQRGTIAWAEGDYSAALSDYKDAKRFFETASDSLGIAKSYNNLGLVYSDISAYDLALDALLPALHYFERTKDKIRIATICNNIANVYSRNDDDAQAISYYERALSAFSSIPDTNGMCMVNNNLGLIYKEAKNPKPALEHFELALNGFQKKNHLLGVASVLNNIASIKREAGEFAEAEEMHRRALAIGEQLGNPNMIQIAQLKLSELFLYNKQYQKAIEMAKASLKTGAELGALLENATAHEALTAAYEKQGQADSALVHFKQFKAINDSIFNKDKSRAITEMRIRYETEVKDGEINHLKQQKAFDQLLKWGLVALIFGIIIIAILIFLRQKAVVQRSKLRLEMDRQANEAQKTITAAKLAAATSEQRRLEDELNYKNKEITQLAMNIAKRHDFLEAMDAELKVLRKEMDEKKLRNLSQTVSQTLSLESERQEFLVYIQDAENTFFMKLDERFPNLSEKEKRLCAMVKLGLSNKEIAAILNIETSSVEVARYRLRKKLNLETNDGLKSFLEEF